MSKACEAEKGLRELLPLPCPAPFDRRVAQVVGMRPENTPLITYPPHHVARIAARQYTFPG